MSQHTVRFTPRIETAALPFWKEVLPLGERRHWPVHSQIFKPDMLADGIHYMLSGRLKAMALSSNGLQRVLWYMGPDTLIGEISTLTKRPCIYFMEADEDSETCFFSQHLLFHTIFPRHPEVSASLMRILACKLYQQSRDTTARNFLPAWKRIAGFLLEIFAAGGSPVRISHAEIATFLGMHRVTVTRALLRLREDGLLEYEQDGLVLTDIERLARLVRN